MRHDGAQSHRAEARHHPKVICRNPPQLAEKRQEKMEMCKEREIFFKCTLHFFWMRNNLFFIMLKIYTGVKKGAGGKGGRWSKL